MMTERWWVLHDDDLQHALTTCEQDVTTADEAYAVLCEHSIIDPVEPTLNVTTREDATTPADRGEA